MVKMASELTFGPQAIDWVDGINLPRMRKERAERAAKILKAHGIPTLLVSPVPEIRYLTGVIGPYFEAQLNYALFFTDHDPVVFLHAGYYQQMLDQASWIKHWRCAHSWLGGTPGKEASMEEARVFAAEILDELKQRGLEKEKVAIFGFDGYAQEALKNAGLTLVPGQEMLGEIKKVKTVDEINCMKMVANITEFAWWKMWQSLRPGMFDLELRNIANNAALEHGAESVIPFNAPRSGPLSYLRGIDNTGRMLQTGDLLSMPLCHVVWMGYCSCTYRTLIVGRKPNDQEKDWYKILLNRVDSIIDAIKPGATTADVAKHFAPANTLGYNQEYEALTIEIGHGMGIGGYNLPVINRLFSLKYPQPIEEGMCIAVECSQGEHRVGGVRLENMIVVTKNGAEIMDHMPREQIWPPYLSFNE